MKPLVDVVDIEGGYLHWGGGGLEFGAGNRGTIPARASVQHECFADEQACAAVFGSYPGSVRTRFSNRKPQTHACAPLAPVLHYNPAQGDLVGGNFWDMRATGRQLGNPTAEQAQGPPTNPVEMGLPDIACAVYRIAPSGGWPRIDSDLRALIRRMSIENPVSGAPRIHGELLKLGFEIAQSSVAKYMVIGPVAALQARQTTAC